jgi:ABC-type branched-subunit amino acid transport system ATPase component
MKFLKKFVIECFLGLMLSQGRVVAEGASEALAGNDAVRAAYVG